MRDGWRESHLGDIVSINPETVDPRSDRLIRYIDLSAVSVARGIDSAAVAILSLSAAPGRARRLIRSGDVLVATVRPYLRGFAMVPPEFDHQVASTGFVVLRARPDVCLPEFVWLVVRTDTFVDSLMRRATGSNYPAVRPGDVAVQPVLVPPVEEQRRIVDLVGAAEAVVRRASALEAAASAGIRAIVAAEWSDSELGRAPVVGIVGDAFGGKFHDGDWIETKDQCPRESSSIRLLQLADIGIGTFLDKSDRWISPDTFERLRCTEVLPGDLLVSRMADPTGRTARVPDSATRAITAVDCTIVRLDPSIADSDYWLEILNSADWLAAADRLSTGSTRLRITRRNLEQIAVPIASIDRQRQVGGVLRALRDVRDAAARESELGAALRSAIAGELLAGRHVLPSSYDRLLDGAA